MEKRAAAVGADACPEDEPVRTSRSFGGWSVLPCTPCGGWPEWLPQREDSTMSDEEGAPKTRGATVELLATVDLGREICERPQSPGPAARLGAARGRIANQGSSDIGGIRSACLAGLTANRRSTAVRRHPGCCRR